MKERVYTLAELEGLSKRYVGLFKEEAPYVEMFITWLRNIEILEEGREFLGGYLTRGRSEVNDV